jgi:hypothetical protein
MIERMVRVAAPCLASSVVAALSGCGSASEATQAQKINLRPGDVPRGSAGLVLQHPVNFGPLSPPVERCDSGIPGPRGVVGYSSQRLYVPPSEARPSRTIHVGPLHPRPLITARSVVYFFKSEAAALRELAVVSGARARDCLRREAQGSRVIGESSGRAGTTERKSLNRPGYTQLYVRPLPTTLPHSYGLRIAGDDTFFPGPPRPEYRDSFGFVAGRRFVVLYTLSEPRPFPLVIRHRLLWLLHRRATGKTAKGVLIIK